MTPKIPISCYIIAQDEADRIALTLECVLDWVDDVIVIDSGSTDGTQEICKALGTTVIHNDWTGYGQQKRFGEDQCKHNWILNLDADEVLSPALINELKSLLSQNMPKDPFFKMRLYTVYPGQKHPRLWADYHNYIRLYDKTKGRFALSETHDAVEPKDGKVVQLQHKAWHYSHRSLSHMIQKTDQYTNLQIKTLKAKSITSLKIRLFTELPLSFIKYYFFRRHFTGGITGFYTAVVSAFSHFSRIAKMLEQAQIAKKKEK